MAVWPLPKITFRELSAVQESRRVALLTSEEAWAALSVSLSLPLVIQAEPSRYDRDLFEYPGANTCPAMWKSSTRWAAVRPSRRPKWWRDTTICR